MTEVNFRDVKTGFYKQKIPIFAELLLSYGIWFLQFGSYTEQLIWSKLDNLLLEESSLSTVG